MAVNWEAFYKKYKGLWIALKDDEETVISSGKTAKEAWRKANKKGFINPILTNIPRELTNYVG